jgi:hypothetical protein
LLTDRAWRRFFAADLSVVGRQLFLDDDPIVIAGIVAADDSLGPDGDLYLPIDESTAAFPDRAVATGYGAIGRLQPGAEASVAKAQLQTLADRIAQAHPEGRTGHTVFVEDLGERFSDNNWRPLYYFLGGAIVMLILSAVNVATALLGRAVRRTRGDSRWGALGGGLGALARLLAEGAVIAIPGGALGVWPRRGRWGCSRWSCPRTSSPAVHDPDRRPVMLFTLAVSGCDDRS